jgi:hypothetical protein
MNYMEELERWIFEVVFLDLFGILESNGLLTDHLRQELTKASGEATKAIKAKVLESYRNGQKACPKCNPRPKGRTSRARG